MNVLRNQVYTIEKDGKPDLVRVLAVIRMDAKDDVVVLISISKKHTLPYEITHTVFQNEIENGSFVLQEGYDPVVCINPTEKQLEAAEYNWDVIGDFVSDEPDCFDAKIRSRFITAKTKETGIQRRQITRLLCRYWSGGMSKHALYPQNSNKGGAGKPRNYAQKPGRKVQFENENQRMTIGDAELALIRKYMDKYYNKHTKYQYRYVYLKMIADCYTDPVTGALTTSYPTENQFRYHASKYVDVKKRFGSTAYRKDMRGITGSSRSEALGPGDVYQIDATFADVYLVSHGDRTAIVGRPELYFVTDVFSRMIVGFYTCLESASWENARMALINTFLPKKTLCAQYGVDITEDMWPCSGLPRELVVDNGELISKASNVIISGLGVTVKNAPAWRPDLKGIVENKFHLLNIDLKHQLPGAVLTDFRERGAEDYRLDATLNLTEFTQIIIHFILNYNSMLKAKHPQPIPEVIHSSVPAIPLELWNWGIQNRTGVLRQMGSQDLQVALAQRGQATVTRRGIKLHNMYYECNTAITEEWFSKARISKTWKIDVGFIPNHMEEIYWIQDDTNYEPCILTDDAKHIFLDATLEELRWHEERQNKQKAAYQGTMMQRNTDHLREVETIIKGATNQQKVMSFQNGKARVKPKAMDIRSNRKAEVEHMKKKPQMIEMDTQQSDVKIPPAPAPKTKSTSSYDDIFSAFQEEDNE